MKKKQESYGMLYILEGMHEVSALMEKVPGHPFDLKSFANMVSRNKAIAGHWKGGSNVSTQKKELMEKLNICFDQIENGDPEKNEAIAKKAEELKDLALEIEPSLKLSELWGMSEEGVTFDAAAIAADEEKPMYKQMGNSDQIYNEGKGDGAYRILINTDCAYFQDPEVQCAAVAALALIVQQKAPLEVWIQQGWLGGGAATHDGITLFPISVGGTVSPANLYFWIGSPYKDSPFSWAVNRILGRRRYGVSHAAEIPCDLYLYNVVMPQVDTKNMEQVADWVAKTAKKMLFAELDPKNIGEKGSIEATYNETKDLPEPPLFDYDEDDEDETN